MEETMKSEHNKKALHQRREGAIKRLENQLVTGTKPIKGLSQPISLLLEDRKRINKELATLKSRV